MRKKTRPEQAAVKGMVMSQAQTMRRAVTHYMAGANGGLCRNAGWSFAPSRKNDGAPAAGFRL